MMLTYKIPRGETIDCYTPQEGVPLPPFHTLGLITKGLSAKAMFSPEELTIQSFNSGDPKHYTLEILGDGIRNKEVDPLLKKAFKDQLPQFRSLFPELPNPFTGLVKLYDTKKGTLTKATFTYKD